MDILDQLINKFGELLDSALVTDSEHNQASATLNDFCENKLSAEQAKELNDIVGSLSSAIFYSSAKAGMKLGARIAVGLLAEEGDNSV